MIRQRLAQPFTDKDYTTRPLRGTWPAQETEPFIRNFGDEMVAVKRPAYYCVVYVGKPASAFYIRGKEKFRKPLPGDIENKGGDKAAKPVTPYLGGGLSLFWTPQYGNALLAMNWSPVTHHGLILRRADTTRWWEDYLKTEFTLDADAGVLTVRGKVEKCPLAYERRYTFGDDALTVELRLAATDRFECAGLVENVPLVLGSVKARGVTLAAPARGRAFRVQDSAGAGVEWVFDTEQSFVKCETGLRGQKWTGHVCGRVEVALRFRLTRNASFSRSPATPRPRLSVRSQRA